ncbi:ribonuclease H-like domain-containing protein [Tanacetum coccineum]
MAFVVGAMLVVSFMTPLVPQVLLATVIILQSGGLNVSQQHQLLQLLQAQQTMLAQFGLLPNSPVRAGCRGGPKVRPVVDRVVRKSVVVVRELSGYCTRFDSSKWSSNGKRNSQIMVLRSPSTGDLYLVTSPSYPQAFLVCQHTWHQRLGHPGSEVLRHLVSNNLISCNKTKSTVLCHACQLGKHVRLPFSLSETVVKSSFDIIHSDLWTSPLLISTSGYVVPTGRVLSPGSDNDSDDASVHSEATIPQQQRNIQPQIITIVSNNNAKFPYLKKDDLKRTRRDHDGRVIILPPTTVEDHIAVQRESKARTTLLQSIPDDHVADFHYMDDARDIWNAVKARMQKILSQLNQLKAKPEDKDINLKFLRALPSSWSQLKTLEVDIKGYSTFSSSQSAGPSHSAFVSTTSASKKMSYADSPSYSSSTYTVPSNSKIGSQRSGNVIEDVLQSFVVDSEPEQELAYEDFDQIEKLDLEEMDLKWQMTMLSVRVHKFKEKAGRKIDFDKKESARFNKKKEIGKKEEDSKALITVDTLVDWIDHDGQSDGVIASKEFGMIASCDTEDAIGEGVAKIYNLLTGGDTKKASTAGDAVEFAFMGVTTEVHNCPFGCDNKYNELQKQYNELNEKNSEYFIQVQAYKNSLKTLEKQKRVLQKNQLTLENNIRVLSIELENTTNLLKHYERINAKVETAKKYLQTKLDNHSVQTEKWRNSSKNLFRLIDSSMSVRTKVGLGFNNYIGENELGWDDSAFSVFTTNSEEVEGRPLFNRFAKADSMKVVPPPLSGDYTPLSDHYDLDESQMSYGTKSSTSSDSNSVSNDSVSCDNIDMSSEVNTNDFSSSDSSVKSSEPKSNDSTSYTSTSSESTTKSEAEIESNFGTPIQEPIIVQDLPSFSCNSSDKNENNSRTSCNKDGYFNKKAGHFRKNASSVSKTGKVNITPARPQSVPTGKPKVPAPVLTGRKNRPILVPTGRQNRPIPVPTGRGDSPSVTFGWWQSTARPMPHLIRPTSSYFQTYTPYIPQMYYNHMQYDGVRWATAVKPSAGCS